MPLPFILAGAALIAGVYGAKKGHDAYQDTDEAEKTLGRARRMFDSAQDTLDEQRQIANQKLESYGELKFTVYEQSMMPFVTLYSHFKHVKLKEVAKDTTKLSEFVSTKQLSSMQQTVMAFQEVVSGGVSALGAGGLAGLAAYGGAGMLATASTGTAISTLSGAAATNATLAWFGGGALSAGGLGVAGGTAVLGGIVAGPVLAIGGSMWAAKAKEAKENAYAKLSEAELAVEEMRNAELKTKAIGEHFVLGHEVLSKLNQKLHCEMDKLAGVLSEERQSQQIWRESKIDEIEQKLAAISEAQKAYDDKNSGFFNSIRNLFSSNPCLPQLLEAHHSFVVEVTSDLVKQNIYDFTDFEPSQNAKLIKAQVNQFIGLFNDIRDRALEPRDDVSWTLMTPKGNSQQVLCRAFALASTVINLLRTDMMTEDGDVTEESSLMLEKLEQQQESEGKLLTA